jgi:hypothetical protein
VYREAATVGFSELICSREVVAFVWIGVTVCLVIRTTNSQLPATGRVSGKKVPG